MKKLILFFSIIVCLFPKLFAQDYGVVCGSFHNTTYTDTLNGKSIQFPQQFLDSIQRFNVISYYQSYPGSKKSSLKSWITFKCPVNQTAAFASYLQTYETALFTEVDYELPDTILFEFDPIDYYWDKNRQIFSNLYGTETLDYMWHLKIIEADLAWEITTGDPSVKVAILDYGYDCSHPDLLGKINIFDPYDHIPSDPLSGYLNDPDLGVHGMGVACIAAGKTNDTQGWTASVGFNSSLVAYQIDMNLVNIYMEKAFHAAFVENASIINISFKGKSNMYIRPRWIEIIKEILDADKVIVRSAGNSTLTDGLYNRLPFSPVIDDRIIVVSSTNHHDKHADPSSDPNIGIITHAHYPEVTICAPGYYLTTATSMVDPLDPPYTHYFSGTSAATPIVSGVCALMKAVQPNLTVNEIKYIIQATADPILDENMYPGQLGAGRINAYKAVKAVDDCYTEPVLEKNITGIVNCSVPMRTSDPIIIQNGGELTISSTLKCSENVYIKVMPGGKLVINGGTLKNGCIENIWQGIIVEGTPTQTQMGVSPNQGIVILNGAIIENAICGVKVGDQIDPSKNGGIVYAYNTDFKNCKNAILFAPYKNMNGSLELANRSKFTDCDFIVDNDFSTTGLNFDCHVKLLSVNGITFTGCRFSNTQTSTNPSARRYANSGITSFNSGFTVHPKCLSNPLIGEICNENDIDIESRFTGLDFGIVANGSDNVYKISVISTKFITNDYGIYLSGVNNAKILNNYFIIGKNNNNITTKPVGLYLQNGTGFRIEENNFKYNELISLPRTGLIIKNSGKENNQIYHNTFDRLTDGQVFDGLNYSTIFPYEGLVSLCNHNDDNKGNDFWVRKINGYNYNGINQYQGEVINTGSTMNISAAGNKFSDQTSVNLQYNNEGNFLFYFYNQANPCEFLESYTSTTISREIAPENSCPSKINTLDIQTIESELTNITFNYANLKYNYNELIDAGNTEELLQLIQDEWSADIWDLRTELLGKSPFLSQEAIMSVAEENLLPPALLLEICLANPDATKDQGFLDKLRYEIPTPLPEYMINLIIASWDEKTLRTEMEEELATFKTYKDEYQNYKTEIILSDSIYNYSDIINHLATRGSYSDYLSMAEIAVNQDNFTQANLYLDILESNSEKLTEEENAEIASFRDYIAIRESILIDSTTIYNLDSAQISTLELYASSNNYRGAILTRNILCMLYNICIDDVPAPQKMLRIGANTNSGKNTIPYIASVRVLPNPANSYASFIWDMKSYDKPAILYIYDQTGKNVMTKEIENAQGQWIWDLKNTPSGVYVYTLKSDQLILYSGKVIVNK